MTAAKFCYGMSLMTTADQFRNSNTHMMHMSFVEFCEFIVRLADVYFQGSEEEYLPLYKKTQFVLDALLDVIEEDRNEFKNYLTDCSSDDDDNMGVENKLIKTTKIKGRNGPQDMLNY